MTLLNWGLKSYGPYDSRLAVRHDAALVTVRCSSAQYWRSSQFATSAGLLAACSLWTFLQRLTKRCSACRYKCSDLGLLQNRYGLVFACCSEQITTYCRSDRIVALHIVIVCRLSV